MRRLGIVLLACIAVLVVTAPAASAKKPACQKLHQRQYRTVELSFRYLQTRSRVTSSEQLEQHTDRDETHRFATLTIGGASCLKPGKGWFVVDPIGVGFSSVGLSSDGDIRSDGYVKGWGIGIRGGQGGSHPRINVQAMHCGEGVFWKSVKALNDVPIPGLSYITEVARWVGGLFLPDDKVKCGNLGTVVLNVRAGRGGKLRVHTNDKTKTEQLLLRGADDWTTRKQYDVLPPKVRRGR
jgi:hypothetical protein